MPLGHLIIKTKISNVTQFSLTPQILKVQPFYRDKYEVLKFLAIVQRLCRRKLDLVNGFV